MGEIRDAANEAFRDYETSGVPASGVYEPQKAVIRSTFGVIDDAVTALRAGQVEGYIAYGTWAELAAHPTGDLSGGAAAKVLGDDAGTHSDPVAGGTVDNRGVYRWAAGSPSGWERIANLEADDAAGYADDAQASADQSAENAVASLMLIGSDGGVGFDDITIGSAAYDSSTLDGAGTVVGGQFFSSADLMVEVLSVRLSASGNGEFHVVRSDGLVLKVIAAGGLSSGLNDFTGFSPFRVERGAGVFYRVASGGLPRRMASSLVSQTYPASGFPGEGGTVAFTPSGGQAYAVAMSGKAVDRPILPRLDEVEAAGGGEGTSWERGAVPFGRTAQYRDISLRETLTWYDGAWRSAGGAAQPSPTFILDDVAAQPAVAFDLNRRLREGYTGPLFQAKRTSDGLMLACKEVAEAIKFGADKIRGVYDQVSGAYTDFGADYDIAWYKGHIAVFNNASTAALLYDGSGAIRDSFIGTGGWALTQVHKFDQTFTAPPGNITLLRLTTNGSTSVSSRRGHLQVTTTGMLQFGGRLADGDAEQAFSVEYIHGGLMAVAVNFDQTDGVGRCAINGRMIRDVEISAGAQTASRPGAMRFYAYPNSLWFGAAIWPAPLAGGDFELAVADQRAAWSKCAELRDSATSWWCDPAAAQDGVVVWGHSRSTGQFAVAEYDEATGALLDYRVLEDVYYGRDDHNEVSVRYLDDGSLIVAQIGHANSVGDIYDGRMAVYFSESGRIADLGPQIVLPSTYLRLNYAQWLEGPKTLALLSNEDTNGSTAAEWFVWRMAAKDPEAAVQCRPIVALDVPGRGSLPGAGQDQLYCRARASGATASIITYLHPTNVQNKLMLMEMDVETGDIWASADRTVIGNAYEEGTDYIVEIRDLTSVIYTPPPGRSVRLMDVSADGSMIAGVDFSNSDSTSGTHFILVWDGVGDRFAAASWDRRDVGETGGAFYILDGGAPAYFGAITFATEPHRGIRLYRCREDDGVWYVDRVDSRNGGLTWQSTNLHQRSDAVIPRVFTPEGGSSSLPAIAIEGSYSTSTSWRLGPVILRS